MAQPPRSDDNGAASLRQEQLSGWTVKYAPALRRYFEKRVGTNEAEDLVQEVFLAMQVRGAIEEPEKADRYLFRVAAHMLAKRRERATWNWAEHATLDDIFEPTDNISPERVLIGQERLARLMAALSDLPPRMAEAFVLHRFDEMTYAEIAGRMGVSVRTVESFIARAVTRVAAVVESVV
jgi:RNA polymerase sigma factor (sigma-70 family)